jgi:hypothetical protein
MLNDKQLMAIDLLVAGKSLGEVCEEVGISRTQLWRWRGEPEFFAMYKRRQIIQHQMRSNKLWAVADRAMDVAMDALNEGDPEMARDILRMTVAGLTDIEYASGDEPDLASPALEESTVHVCDRCGKECRSAAGLASHSRTHAA